MKFSTIFSAGLVALSPVGAAIVDAAVGHKDANQFTFTLPVLPGLPAGIPTGPGPAAQCTINTAGFNEATIASIINTPGQVPTAAEMATIRNQVQAYIHSIDDGCNRNCCIGLCMVIVWVPIIGLAYIASCMNLPA